MRIAIIDYGMGNIFSVCSAVDKIGYNFILTNKREEILSSDRVILPGVGAFDKAMHLLKNLNLDTILEDYISSGNPVLGICIGMQVMMGFGEEGAGEEGLKIIEGNVKKINPGNVDQKEKERFPIPHISWSKVIISKENNNLNNFFSSQDDYMYFVHSYQCLPFDKKYISAYSQYGSEKITASIQKENVFGTQFHPERSGPVGLNFLKNFIEQK
ncbi:MAG: imidazole glycerol phosphate synthase subunit HisH [Flavobacteriaceae bacterium]|nr:imidazole glycerol phosphate synthase subunit HisH [Flavobacteriaceae bacterium]|tara:strand:- start:10488 stop:11129 length:642 start_codon:yes stop_codon:yes gene_type:complete